MIVACALRNLDDATGWLRIDEDSMDFIGGIALNIFLVVALMDLKIWQLAGQALPLFVILVAQLALLVGLAILVSYRLMGRDYDSAVMAGGFIGFAMGTTANAVANMRDAGGPLRSGTAGLPRRAAGRRLLHRLHQRAGDHRLRELVALRKT